MAALSARLANMGFMKRAEAAKAARSQANTHSDPEQPTAAAQASLRQQKQYSAANSDSLVPGAAAARAAMESGQTAAVSQDQRFSARQLTDPAQGSNQQQCIPPEQPKFKLSDNIANMKFMQRAQLKRSREEAFDRQQEAKDAAEWTTVQAVQDRGCLIIHERDPLPMGVSGRMSFGFGHLHDLQLAEEAEKEAAQAAAAAAADEKDRNWTRHLTPAKDATQHAKKRQRRQ